MNEAKRPRRMWTRGVAALGMTLILPACGRTVGQLPVFPVAGEVRLDGEPTEGAFLVFHPIAGAATEGDKVSGEPIRPTGQVKSDGSFRLTTYASGDGAPAGDYAVTVEWRKLVTKGPDVAAGPNVIPPDYATPAKTPLKITVQPSPNTLDPFQIKKK